MAGGPYKGKGRSQQKTKEERDALKAQRYCNGCGEKGHYWRQCPKRGESSTTPSSHTVQQLPAYVHLEVLNDEPSPLSASVETVLTTRDPREWLLDSGASKHMTSSTNQMKNLRPHLGKVYIGDNSTIPIHSEGTLDVLSDGKGGYLFSVSTFGGFQLLLMLSLFSFVPLLVFPGVLPFSQSASSV